MSRISAACGRRLMYNTILQSVRAPERWKQHLAVVEETCQAGHRAPPLCSPNPIKQRFTMHNCQVFRGMPHWHPILLAADAEKLRAYSDPAVRQQLPGRYRRPPEPRGSVLEALVTTCGRSAPTAAAPGIER